MSPDVEAPSGTGDGVRHPAEHLIDIAPRCLFAGDGRTQRAPYFDEPFYVGYDVGGFELGLWPAGDPSLGPVAYWGVDDIDAALAHVLSLGATQRGEVSDVGERIRMVELTAPMGDVFGLIENPNFVAAAAPATYDGPGR